MNSTRLSAKEKTTNWEEAVVEAVAVVVEAAAEVKTKNWAEVVAVVVAVAAEAAAEVKTKNFARKRMTRRGCSYRSRRTPDRPQMYRVVDLSDRLFGNKLR